MSTLAVFQLCHGICMYMYIFNVHVVLFAIEITAAIFYRTLESQKFMFVTKL